MIAGGSGARVLATRRWVRLRYARDRTNAKGQSLVELALVIPVMLLLLIGIADLGRLYTSAVAIESAAREAADFGAFEDDNWAPMNIATTLDEMTRRACTAAAGSHLQDYESTDPDDKTCTNPTFTCTLERNGVSTECASSGGRADGVDCFDPNTDPACTVHVQLVYQFRLLLAIPPLPGDIPIARDSYFRISNLTAP